MESKSDFRQSWITVGTDRVLKRGDNIVIDAAHEFEHWEPRGFRKVQIVYDGEFFFVTEKKPGTGGRITYHLKKWPETLNDMPGFVFEYDECLVLERDEIHAAVQRRIAGRWFFVMIYPLIGYFDSRIKKAVCYRYKFSVRTTTMVSICCTVIFVLMIGVFGFLIPLLVFPIIILLSDSFLRFSKYLDGSQEQYGFFEWAYAWMFRRIRKLSDR